MWIALCVVSSPLSSIVYGHTQEAETVILKVILNAEDKGDFFLLLTEDGDVLFPSEDMKGFGFKRIPEKAEARDEHVSLRSLSPEVSFEIDVRESTLIMMADPKLFEKSIINLGRKPRLDVVRLGENTAFLNYSVGYTMGSGLDYKALNVPFKINVRGGGLSGHSDFSYSRTESKTDFTRSITNVTWDDQRTQRRYILGDFFAASTELGVGGTFGGIHISKNFSMMPYFVRYPGLELSGMLRTPSEVEVYSNDMLIKREKLPPGEFEFTNLPVTTGPGETAIIIRDAYGEEERIINPFYISSRLLKTGLSEYNYNLGFKRKTGVKDYKYGGLAFTGFHRRGITKGLTGGFRAEVDKDIINLGPTATFIIGTLGEMSTSAALSRENGRYGYAGSMSCFYRGRRSINSRLSLKVCSRGYANISTPQSQDRPRFEGSISVGIHQRVLGSLSASYTIQDRYEGSDREKLSLFCSKPVVRNSSLFISANRTWEDVINDEILIGLNVSLGGRESFSFHTRIEENKMVMRATVQKSAPFGLGRGYRFQIERDEYAGTGNQARLRGQARFESNGPYGIYSADWRRTADQNSYDLKLSGSIAFVNNHLYLSRPITDSFALVKVGDVEGVKVKYSNQEMGTTNRKGEALVPRLVSYHDNRLFIEPVDLPLNYNILETTKYVSPPYRGGGIVEFHVEKFQAFEGRILFKEKGKTIPAEYAGLEILVDGKTIQSIVGKDGTFYLENLPPGRYPVRVFKEDKECRFHLIIPESDDVILNIGEIICNIE